MRHLRRAGTREVILGVMSVLVIGFAVYYFVTHVSGKEKPPPGSIGFYCTQCQYRFKMTNEDFDTKTEKRDFRVHTKGQALYQCPKCKNYVAQRADEDYTPPPLEEPNKA